MCEREERMGGGRASRQVRLGRDRGKRQRYRETERHRNREIQRDIADNKNP
jgi:hypothetical protein